ncbi:MAG: DNA polymerase/3'-5' exonuclease PolX [Candidatus Yanofskybacteria bacterium]|nr:DNA polymerase/3'-5' exonuclease PolX [Candidatus Yanofskybacteria bacterium]
MKNTEIADLFFRMAAYLEMEGVAFKPQAYERAAMTLETMGRDIEEIYREEGKKGLMEIQGIGASLADHIEEFLKTGTIKEYEAFRKRMPVDVEELLSVEGVGPKLVKELWEKLRVANVDDLERAAKEGKLQKLSRFGAKREQNILQGITFLKKGQGRKTLGFIYPYVEEYVRILKSLDITEEAAPAGSFRRMKETVGDVDILVASKNAQQVIDQFLARVPYLKIWGKGDTKVSLRAKQGFNIDVRVVPMETFGAALQYFTGSKEHNVRLRAYAVGKGLKVSEYGVFKGNRRIAGQTEQEVYEALGMQYIEPELREDTGEIEAALQRKLPDVIPYGSLRGDLQIQTDWTDGAHSIEDMAKEAKAQGLSYIAITDHTRDLAMTNGCDEKKLLSQMREIDKINKKISGITILKGAEVNIRKDGSLDISDEVLAKLDVVGASVHSHFRMPKKEMTERVVRAIRSPHVDILFHPTGRLIQKREACELDMDRIFKVAKETGTVLEINAYPDRLDLRDADIRQAKQQGVRMVIDSDAHAVDHIKFLRFGIAQARRGWAEKKDILNTKPLHEFTASLKDKTKAF